MKYYLQITALLASFLFLSGCSEGGGGAGQAKKKRSSPFPVDGLSPTTEVIRVNGVGIRQSDYIGWYRVKNKIFRLANGIKLGEKNGRASSFAQDSRIRVPSDLIQRELMRQEAERLKVVVPPERVRKMERRFMGRIRRSKEPFESISSVFGVADGELVRKYVFDDARDEVCLEKASTNDLLHVTEAEIDAQVKWVKEWNVRADATNEVQRARALAAKKEIENAAGLAVPGVIETEAEMKSRIARFVRSFASVTKKRADKEKQDGSAWETVSIPEVVEGNEALAKWLLAAKPGDVSPPLEMEDGIAVVGLVLAFEDEDAQPGEKTEVEYELVRCTFDQYERIDEIEDRAELAKEMIKARREAALRELGERLTKNAKIEFPKGEKVFFPKKARKKPKSRAKE